MYSALQDRRFIGNGTPRKMTDWVGLIWIFIALLGTRRAFRLVIPRSALYPTMGHYVLAFLVVSFWWWLVGFVLTLFV